MNVLLINASAPIIPADQGRQHSPSHGIIVANILLGAMTEMA